MKNPEAEKYYERAVRLAASRDFTGALPLCDRALALDPANARSCSDKAIALFNLRRYLECIDLPLQAMELDPAEMPCAGYGPGSSPGFSSGLQPAGSCGRPGSDHGINPGIDSDRAAIGKK